MKMMTIIGMLIISFHWDSGDYKNYTADTFFSRNDVQQSIDLENPDLKLIEAAVFYATNEVRKDNGLPELEYNTILNKAARNHSEDMVELNFADHINKKNKARRTPLNRVMEEGGKFNGVSENIGILSIYTFGSSGQYYINQDGQAVDQNGEKLLPTTYTELARRAVVNWMNSLPHRKNLLSDYTYLGCGVSGITMDENNLPEIHITQNFGKY